VFPTLGPIPTHALFVGLGVLAAVVVFLLEARRRHQTDDKIAYVVLGALIGGAVFMRLGTWMQHLDLRQNASLVEQWLYGNRSILGGLFGAWLGVHITKKLVGYRVRTGDLFAPAVALGMAIGRIGCLLTELPGTPTGSSYGITLSPAAAARLGSTPGVALHPSFVYDRFPGNSFRRHLVLATAPSAGPGRDADPLPRRLRDLPLFRGVHSRQ